MSPSDVAEIETHLNLSLPHVYRELLLAAKGKYADFSPHFEHDCTEILITNLELRMSPVQNSFGGKSWPSGYICIGSDGCGNFNAIDVDDPQCAVHFFDHEVNSFETIAKSLTSYLDNFFGEYDRSAAVFGTPTPEEPTPQRTRSDELVVARTTVPRESVLDPIALEEWTAFVDADPELIMRGYRMAKNPFTQEETRFDYPGLAIMEGANSVQEFFYIFGRVLSKQPSEKAIIKLEQAANALNARVHRG